MTARPEMQRKDETMTEPEATDEVQRLRSLIGRYVRHVYEEEGHDYLDFCDPRLTLDEAAELRRYAEQATPRP